MTSLTPGPEDAEKQENGAANLASSTHSRRLSLRTCWHEVLQAVPLRLDAGKSFEWPAA
jgi:hypothetical protein